MNLRWKENPVFLQVLVGFLLILFLSTLYYVIGLIGPSVAGLDLFARANSTRTSIALTSGALMGPFPTPTGPTPTPSRTPSHTFTPTPTPSSTPSSTPFRYFINTGTPRTLVPKNALTSTAAASGSTRTSIPPPATNPPPQPTNPPPQPTVPPVQPTNPPRKATRTPKPPKPRKPTKTPKQYVPLVECVDPQSCSYFMSEKATRIMELWKEEIKIPELIKTRQLP